VTASRDEKLMDKFKARIAEKGVVYFDSQVELAQNTLAQVSKLAQLPFVEKVAVMPDAHVGMGCTIGTVMATESVLVPAAVGVDIGCGIDAWQLSIKRDQIADHQLHEILAKWQKAIPHGRTDNGGLLDEGRNESLTPEQKNTVSAMIRTDDYADIAKAANGAHPFVLEHWGSLGTGNHFVELAYDQNDDMWLMIHSGSRGPGAKLAAHYIKVAKELMKKFYIKLPDDDLAFLPMGTPEYNEYIRACMWAQQYAFYNRLEMAKRASIVLSEVTGMPRTFGKAANTPHNFIRREHHFGKNMWITRKGASSASKGELVCIPGSMGTNSYVCEGTGNFLSMGSSSHGAGRAMSRTAAINSISQSAHKEALGDVIVNNLEGTVDESPAAYKDIDAVMASQTALVEIQHKLTPVLNMKG
jgi:tRNA-splicing ligase RtcB